MTDIGPQIASWLRDYIPSLVPLDLYDGLAVWRDAGWLLGIAGIVFALVNVQDIWKAVRRRDLRESCSNVAFSASLLAFAAGMAMVDIGWLCVFVAAMFLATRLARGNPSTSS